MKKIFALLLTFSILLGSIPFAVFAEEGASASPSVNTDNTTIEGTNGFGVLLEDALNEYQDETAEKEDESVGYNVIELVIEGNTATVTYESYEEAYLVVAIYSEDGKRLLNSGKATVSPDETSAEIAIEGEMPQYFMAAAYLMDTYDLSPLCTAYETPVYTKEMQELLASTVDDYDEELVLNLDDDNTTNFAVYQEGVIRIDYQSGFNTVALADYDTGYYVLENVDATVAALQPGDIFAYSYDDEEMLIVKVSDIVINGTTATITSADLEVEEVFSHMKLESDTTAENATVDTSEADEGVSFVGIQNPEASSSMASSASTASPMLSKTSSATARDKVVSNKWSLGFEISKKFERESASGSLSGEIELSASVDITLENTLKYYITFTHQHIELKTEISVKFEAGISGEIKAKVLKLGSFGVSPVAGVYIGFEPALEVQFSGSVTLELTYTTTIGFSFTGSSGLKNLTTAPKTEFNFNIEGEIFIGVDFNPTLKILGGVAEYSATALAGLVISGEMKGTAYEHEYNQYPSSKHTCEACLALGISAKFKFQGKVKLLNCEYLTFNVGADITATVKLKDSYYSFDKDEWGDGKCPYTEYRVTVNVIDKNENDVENAEIHLATGEYLGTTNENGVFNAYLPEGSYAITTKLDGVTIRSVAIVKDATTVTLTTSEKVLAYLEFLDKISINPTWTTDKTPVAEGDFGSSGTNLHWTFYGNGLLEITGEGSMESFPSSSVSWSNNAPWSEHINAITDVHVDEGVTSIGSYAFSNHPALSTVVIDNSVTSIGSYAFSNCTKLEKLKLPVDLNISYSFYECSSIKTIQYTTGQTGVMMDRLLNDDKSEYWYRYFPEYYSRNNLETVIFDEGITHIGGYAFYHGGSRESSALATVILPSTLQSIGNSAFYRNHELTQIDLPEGLTSLGDHCFGSCSGLENIDIPSTLSSIPSGCFDSCTSLTEVIIPNTVTTIDSGAFANCTGITELTLPIDTNSGFSGCTNIQSIHYTFGTTGVMRDTNENSYGSPWYFALGNLETVIFDEGITHIGDYAFYCKSSKISALATVILPSTLESIGNSAFHNNDQITQIDLPEGLTSLGDFCFYDCNGLESINIPSTLSSIPPYCFESCTSLTEVIIPNTVTTIDSCAFVDCTGITELTLPVDVYAEDAFLNCTNIQTLHYTFGTTGKMIDRSVYSGSNQYTTYPEYQSRENLKNLILDEGITYLGSYAFSDTAFNHIVLPSTIESLGSYTFERNFNLSQILLPEGLTSLGEGCFGGCNALTSIEIPSSVTSIPDYCFSGCASLISIALPSSIVSLGNYCFDQCSALTSIEIPSSVTSIPDYCFRECLSLSTITLPSSIKSLGRYCFDQCFALTSIEIPSSVTSIPDCCFNNCRFLTTITLPSSIESIGCAAFYNNTSLQAIIFTGDAPTIDDNAFVSVTTTLYYPTDNDTWTSVVSNNYGGTLTWVEGIPETYAAQTVQGAQTVQEEATAPSFCSTFSGDYGTQILEKYTLKTASFTDLAPGKEYLLLAVREVETEDILAPDNLLYITQGVANEDGTIYFEYVQREYSEISYVFLCGPSKKDLNDAVITFPEITEDGLLQMIRPSVVYDGETLTLYEDYVIVGDTAFCEAGEYLCYIRGIRDYTGLVPCTYVINPASFGISGQPADQSATLYEEATFTVTANGNGLTYRWQYSDNGTDWYDVELSGADTASLTVEATQSRNGQLYRCVVTDENGDELISDTAVLTVVEDDSEIDPTLPAFSVGMVTGTQGDTVTVQVDMSENPGITSFWLNVEYDRDLLELTAYSAGDLPVSGSQVTTYPFSFSWFDMNSADVSSAATIIDLTFKIKDDAELGETAIKLIVKEAFNAQFVEIPFETVNGAVNVLCNHAYGDWSSDNDATHSRICSKCGGVETVDHAWDEGVVTTEETHTTTGVMLHTCTVCGQTKDEVIPVDPEHIFGDWASDGSSTHTRVCICGEKETVSHELTAHPAQAATCTAIGWDAYDTCGVCEYTSYIELPALGHDVITHAAQAPTCTDIGWDAYDACSRCDHTTYVEIAALGHDLTTHAAKRATCTETGWNEYVTCSRCDHTTYAEIAALGHDMVHHAAQAPTCTEIGWNAYDACSRCELTSYVELPATGHDLTTHTAKRATCTEIGWNEYVTCSRCDHTTYAEIAALGHDMVHHAAQAPTCTEIGWNAYDACSRCELTSYVELPALGHTMGEWYVYVEATRDEYGEERSECANCDHYESRVIEWKLPGDTNGDGTITMRDVVLLQQYLNQWDVEPDLSVADVNEDGRITMRDVVAIQQSLNQ